MIVYGDLTRRSTVGEKLDRINQLINEQPLQHSDDWRRIFLEVSELTVALQDAGLPCKDLLAQLRCIGRGLMACWFGEAPRTSLPRSGTMREVAGQTLAFTYPEGYAFYAVYPEAYWMAGRQLRGRPGKVIGIRSIGLGLGVMVALGADIDEVTSVRPTGHPFARQVALPAGWSVGAEDQVAIVDEGPGLSGSSFVATAQAVLRAGADVSQLRICPSHGNGPADHAGLDVRTLWPRLHVQHVSFEQTFGIGQARSRLHRLSEGAGLARASTVKDLSAGHWREHVPDGIALPSNPSREARKYQLGDKGRAILAKFAGLGELGGIKQRRGTWLAQQGWSPPILALRDGFIFQPWIDNARSLDGSDLSVDDLTSLLAQYIHARRMLDPEGFGGADPLQLAHMARNNIRTDMGEPIAVALEPILADAQRLRSGWAPVATDNRMHRFEWRVREGRIWKMDAVDHCCAHDMVGCQDPCWDVAAAIVEFELPLDATENVAQAFAPDAQARNKRAVDFSIVCYCAFQLGLWSEVGQSTSSTSPNLIPDIYRHRVIQIVSRL